jgi:FkbM family methyltransferase
MLFAAYGQCAQGEMCDTNALSAVNDTARAIHKMLSDVNILEPPACLALDRFNGQTDAAVCLRQLETLSEWLNYVKIIVSPFGVDYEFAALIRQIASLSYDQILAHIIQLYTSLSDEMHGIINRHYNGNPDFWGTLDAQAGDFNAFENKAKTLHEHWKDIFWLYSQLGDYRSKAVLLAVVSNWFSFDTNLLGDVRDKAFLHYFDMDLLKCDQNEVMADVGGYTGDTVIDYIKTYGPAYKQIYCYEIMPKLCVLIRHNLQGFERVELRQKGVAAKNGVLRIFEHEKFSSCSHLDENGTIEIEAVALDEDIKKPLTLIKMDIEGGEKEALRGCVRHIQANKPKLAISLYHKNDDLWEIPRMIDEMSPGYNFYLRYYGGNACVSELVLIAVP